MTTVAAKVNAASVSSAAKRGSRTQALKPDAGLGLQRISYTRTLTAAESLDFNASGDYLELFTFPPNCLLVWGTVTVPDLDAHATPTVTVDVMAGSTVLVNNSTAGQAGGEIPVDPAGLVDVSDDLFKLKIETVPATPTAVAYASAFTCDLLIYVGAAKSL